MSDKTAVIAGHNTRRPGAYAFNGTREHEHTKELQHLISNEMMEKAILIEGSSIEPVTEDEYYTLVQVVDMINSDREIKQVIDIHFNNNNPLASGTETIVHPKTTIRNKKLAGILARGISEIIGIPHRKRVAERDYIFPSETPRGTLAIIEKTIVPAILIEVCFLNTNDFLKYKEVKEEVAEFIANTIIL